MIKLVAFDWNGTLIADLSASVRANNIVYPLVGLKPLTTKRYQETFQVPIRDYWLKTGLSKKDYAKNFKRIEHIYHLNYERLVNKCRSRSGVSSLLRWLKNNHISSLIYSNHIVPQITRHFPRLGFNNLIGHVIARQPGDFSQLHSRTKSQKLNQYAITKKLKADQVLTIGDTEEEIEIGKQFGYHTVGITGGWNSVARLKKHHPDFLIHNMLELKNIVKQLNKTGKKL